MHAPPRPAPTPGEMAAPGRPGPENFQECPAPPRPAPPHPENAPGFNCSPAPKIFSSAPPRPVLKQKKAAPCIPDFNCMLAGNATT